MTPEPWPAGTGLEVFDEIDSTQSEARRRALVGEIGPTWIVARRQTAGHGRRGRSWHSPVGNLMTTVLLRPEVEIANAPQISFVAALAVADLFERLAPGHCTLKWPNDPLLDGRKAAGVLPDSAGRSDGRLDWLLVGFGVNLATSPDDAPYPTASVAQITGAAPDPDIALTILANAWQRRFDAWQTNGFAAIRTAWLARAHGLQKDVRVQLPNETFTARFEGLDETGALIARLPSGETRLVSAGDVFPVAA
ncbi:Bifunctional ligase/repressor BirA [Alphaproteobacteria bacterium SO-S41]|nr:Bifunctional ligase/repressor BirA [Alphaproteobacteria bacterium SO-S41]